MAKFLYFLKGAFINFDAMDELGLNMQQYAFLEAVHLWQQNSGNGWAGPGLANRYTSMALFKQKLASRCGIANSTLYDFIRKMKERGLLEEKTNRIRVTDNYRLALGVGKREKTSDEEPPQPSEAEGTISGKTFWGDSPFVQFEGFKTAVNMVLPLETDLDIAFYFKQIGDYYTTENTNAYKNWPIKIGDWIKRQIKDGDVRRIGGASSGKGTKRTNEELLQDLRLGYAAVRDVNDLTTFKPYKETVTKYMTDAKEADIRGVLPPSVLADVTYYTEVLNVSGGLAKHIEETKKEKKEAKTVKTATDDS